MSIIFTTVARGGIIIATYSSDGTDLVREVQKLLETPFVKNEQRRMSRYLFSFFKSDQLTFICATGIDCDKQAALSYLETLSNRWAALLGDKSATAGPHSLTRQAKSLFESAINDSSQLLSKTEKIKRDFDQTQKIVADSVGLAVTRESELTGLSAKSEDLVNTSEEFKNQATQLKNKMRCSWIKSYLWYIVLAVVLLYIILVFSCGGMALKPRCF